MLPRAVLITAGLFHSMAVTEAGELYRWGLADHGVLCGGGGGQAKKQCLSECPLALLVVALGCLFPLSPL